MGRQTRQRWPLITGLLVVLLCSFAMVQGPVSRAQDTAPEPCDSSAGITPAANFPPGLVVEEVLAETPLLPDTAAPFFSSRISFSCVEPNTAAIELEQDIASTIIVVEGELEFQLIAKCLLNPGGACDPASEGVADLFRATDPATKVELTESEDDEWLTLVAGDVLVISDVTAAIRTTGSQARFIASGVAEAQVAGGACPCGKSPP